jgi:hypothetical protein
VSEGLPPAGANEPAASTPRRFRRFARRTARWTLATLAALVATVIMLFFSVDLGRFPQLRAWAERGASDYLGRPMHIGRITAQITPGVFALDDVVIEGRRPEDLPFFTARRIYVYVPWWTLIERRLIVEVGLTDWRMVVETWRDGHNVPRLAPRRSENASRPPFTTTVRSVIANGGEFVFNDHATPWSVKAPNLSFALARAENLREYVGRATFTGGTVQIQQFKPMRASLTTRFALDGPRVQLRHIDLTTNGSRSHVNGMVDFGNWPAQTYNINSTVDFATMKDIFFANETWRVEGEGQFTGIFRFFRGGRELAGDFDSAQAFVNEIGFDDLHGSLVWTPDRFAVTHADAGVLGGRTRFAYTIAPLGAPGGSRHTFSTDYAGVSLAGLSALLDRDSLSLAGQAAGSLALTWPSGQFATGRQGKGHTAITPPAGADLATRALPPAPMPPAYEPAPFDAGRPLDPIALGGDIDYVIEPAGWAFTDSWAATSHTYVAFGGRLGPSGESSLPFHVTSHDWQESDRLLARIMTAVAGPTRAIEVGGRGTFDGTMTGSFAAPRIAGHFEGESTRVWDVTWGRGVADAVIAGGYVDISNSRFGDRDDAFITADGRFALGFRRDGAEEIAARVKLVNWPMRDLRHAFGLDEWSVDGTVADASLELTGRYRDMYGRGRLRIDGGTAWNERFQTATADVSLEGSGMRLSRFELVKGPDGGLVSGVVHIGWDGTYQFEARGQDLPVESLDNFKLEGAPLTGRLQFAASGAGEFDAPAYTFRGSVEDLFAGDQGIGRVEGELGIAGRTLMIQRFVASSPLLNVNGRGTIAFDERYNSNLHLQFTESSLDPYLKFFSPELSPYARVILTGAVDVVGPLGAPLDLSVDATVDTARLTMFDYNLDNDGPIELGLAEGQFRIGRFGLTGADTKLELTGGADAHARTWDLAARGSASLSILQLVFPAITTAGAATLNASLTGSFDAPRLTGEAAITNGRLRPLASAHGLEAVNGTIRFEETGAIMDDLTGRVAGGDVVFGGAILREGYRLTEYNLTAVGRSLRLRYPAGFESTVNMDLGLLGPLNAPRLAGTVDVLRVRQTGGGNADLLALATAGTTGLGLTSGGGAAAPAEAAGLVALDIQVTAPRMTFINTSDARIEGTADLRIGGTFDRPIMTGSIDILGGEVLFSGNRIFVRESAIDFRNPDRIEPIFDITADTRVRTPGQTVDINIRLLGPMSSFTPTFTSDPPLPATDVISLMLGGTPNLDTAQQRALASPQESQQRMMQATAAAILASAISSRVGQVVERTLALDTVQITPYLAGEVAFQQLNPSARITLGKRVSPRVFLTYSRTLGNSAAQDEIILLEYDQNDRVSWILSRNEDRTFALDFRIRYVH